MKRTSALLASFLILLAAVSLAGQSSTPAQLTINDSFVGTLLTGDGQGAYVDHSLPGGNPCVTAWVSAKGLFFIYMDYNPAYGSPGQCDSALGISGRAYYLTFPATSGICSALNLPVNALGDCQVEADGGTNATNGRIRADQLFATGDSTTPVAFMFNWNGNSYSLQPDNGASVSGTGNSRTATSNGTATLWRIFSAPQKPKKVGSSFVFPFQFMVQD
jgi:hypothetical protein